MVPPTLKNARINVGLLGGSFNPAHEGHRYISLEAMKRLRLDEVWWLVSPQNPLKPTEGMQPLEVRLAYAWKIGRHPRLRVTDIEAQLHTSFTYDTLLKLKKKFSKVRFVWLMGADNLAQFPCWKRWQDITKLLPIAVFDRGGVTTRALAGKMAKTFNNQLIKQRECSFLAANNPPAWGVIRIRKHPASATELRKSWKQAQ